MVFLIAVIVLLIGAVGYLFRKTRLAMPAAVAAAPADVIATPVAATHLEVSVASKAQENLTALLPAESPASVTGFATGLGAPRTDEAMPVVASAIGKRSLQ